MTPAQRSELEADLMRRLRLAEAEEQMADLRRQFAAGLTWTCMACREERADEWISVVRRKVVTRPDTDPLEMRAIYCNDRAECVRGAIDVLDKWCKTVIDSCMVPLVHVLFVGRTLCDRWRRWPEDWPDGSKWIRVDEPDHFKDVTCDACREKAEEMAKRSPATYGVEPTKEG